MTAKTIREKPKTVRSRKKPTSSSISHDDPSRREPGIGEKAGPSPQDVWRAERGE